MKKFLLMLLTATTTLAFLGCASSSSVRTIEVNSANKTSNTILRSYGAVNVQTLGPIFLKTTDYCSVNDLVNAAIAKYPETADVVNIHMEETTLTSGTSSTHSCKYSGLAVTYKQLSLKEYSEWKSTYSADLDSIETAIEGNSSEDVVKTAEMTSSTEESIPADTSNTIVIPSPVPDTAEPSTTEKKPDSTSNEVFFVR